MNRRRILMASVGVFVAALGLLWSFQGAGLVHLRPILCVSNCEPITGTSPAWLVAGVIAVLVGLGLAGMSLRHYR
jgi:hypothetical protein